MAYYISPDKLDQASSCSRQDSRCKPPVRRRLFSNPESEPICDEGPIPRAPPQFFDDDDDDDIDLGHPALRTRRSLPVPRDTYVPRLGEDYSTPCRPCLRSPDLGVPCPQAFDEIPVSGRPPWVREDEAYIDPLLRSIDRRRRRRNSTEANLTWKLLNKRGVNVYVPYNLNPLPRSPSPVAVPVVDPWEGFGSPPRYDPPRPRARMSESIMDESLPSYDDQSDSEDEVFEPCIRRRSSSSRTDMRD